MILPSLVSMCQLGFSSKRTSILQSKGCIFSISYVSSNNHMAGTIACWLSFPSTKVDQLWFWCLGHWFSRHLSNLHGNWLICRGACASPTSCYISSSVASPQTITCKTPMVTVLSLLVGIPNLWHPWEWFWKVWSHLVGFLVKTPKHFAVQGLHFQQKLRFQQQSHGRHHWLLVVFPLKKTGLIVVLMPWTLIFKTFIESAWELVDLPRGVCQSHHWLDFKLRGITTNHHMQNANGDSLVIVGGHPLTCGHPLEWFWKVWSHPAGFFVKTHKHFAVQGLHFQQKLRFQQQSHGRHHWLLVVFPLNKSGLIVVLMPWTLIFKTFVESAWELVNLPRGICQPHQLLHFKQRGITTKHHVQDTNGDSLVIVGGHPPNMCQPWEWFGKVWSHLVGFLVKTHQHFTVQGFHFQHKLRF